MNKSATLFSTILLFAVSFLQLQARQNSEKLVALASYQGAADHVNLDLASGGTLEGPKGKKLNFSLQKRDSETNEVIHETDEVESSKVGVVIVDPWNFHWCMTACERVSAMAPRWSKALDVARKLEMPIIWCPSDVIGSYSGYPQRERVLGMELVPVPVVRNVPDAEFTAPGGGCMCGPGISCKVNYGWDAINPDFHIEDSDLIASSTQEVYSVLKDRGITHVIYMGLHTNICLYGKPGALKYMWQAGLDCMLARDINDAITSYDPATGFTPDQGTKQTDEDIERAGIPTINVVEEFRKVGMWDDNDIYETVRIAPWGKPDRPYFFENSCTVTLTTPLLKGVDIRYTLDGSEPTYNSQVYNKPIQVDKTVSLKTAAFKGKKMASLTTDAYYKKLPPVPPLPDIYLDDLQYILDPYGDSDVDPVLAEFLWKPKIGKSYEGLPLRIRNVDYDKGMGFLAPSSARYKLNSKYGRFVAKVGIDDNKIDNPQLGGKLVMHCSVVFRVFIDGKMMDESPVMRIGQEPWRFDVKVPADSRYINLVCMDAGSRNILDLGNWVDSGFILK